MFHWALLLAVVAPDAREQFEMRVRPVLAKNCYSCHTQTKLGGLRLDSRESILKGGNSGPAVVPEKPEESLLVRAVRQTHERFKMPPSGKLSAADVEAIEEWVRLGAYWPTGEPSAKPASAYVISAEQKAFWSFQPVKKAAVPAVKNEQWAKSPIDRFVLAKLEEKGLSPAPAADKRTLIRRASFDLTGLPPAPGEVDAFLKDESPDAFARVVDRLLGSRAYGERWGRHWLDVARYADDKLNSTQDEPYANAFRYRNWVIRAINEDMPYNVFLKAQIAGDLMESSDPERYAAGTGFFALSPEFQDERVDALSRGFLGVTVACAQCHDHKFDPIPTKDFYALQGIFLASKVTETPLAPEAQVKAYQEKKKEVEKQEERVKRFYQQQTEQVGEMLAARTARYLLAARKLGPAEGLDTVCLERWVKYLAEPRREHPYLKHWDELVAANAPAAEFEKEAQKLEASVIAVVEDKHRVDKENEIRLGLDPSRNDLANASLVSLERDKYIFWRDLFAAGTKDSAGFFSTPDGIYYFGRGKIERFLEGPWKTYLADQKAALEALKKALPEQYPFLHTLAEGDKPTDMRIWVRGDRNNKGDVAPRAFLSVLARDGKPDPFAKGSGRLELAEKVASADNPLTARVIVNRVWMEHFGRAIVDTPGNFGQLGERPSHPELLDYLAAEFVENGWSLKKLHRTMLLSSAYQVSATRLEANQATDPDNRWFWRANRRRLDAETIRDAMLAVSGLLDPTPAEKPAKLDDSYRRRTVYGQISRRKTDSYLSLFDFPNPNGTSEKRIPTSVPPQRLFFMNSPFVESQAKALAERVKGDAGLAYGLVYGRPPDAEERRLAEQFLASRSWTEYARVLLSSNEFLFVD